MLNVLMVYFVNLKALVQHVLYYTIGLRSEAPGSFQAIFDSDILTLRPISLEMIPRSRFEIRYP